MTSIAVGRLLRLLVCAGVIAACSEDAENAPVQTAASNGSGGHVTGGAGGSEGVAGNAHPTGNAGIGGASGSTASAGSPNAGASGVAGGAGSPEGSGAHPVGPPTGVGDQPGTTSNVQAMRTIFLGDTGWDGTVSPTGDDWQSYGFNVDGQHYTNVAAPQNHCILAPGGDVQHELLDGENGLDNSFGRNVLPLLSVFATNPSATVTTTFQDGASSYAVRLADFGHGSSYPSLVGEWFQVRGSDSAGSTVGDSVPPTSGQWADGSYVWHPLPDSLLDPTVNDPTHYVAALRFPTSYLNQSTWVSNASSDITLSLNLAGSILPLVIHHAVIQLDYAPDHTSGTSGIISGILSTVELGTALNMVEPNLSLGPPCWVPLPGLVAQVIAASDVPANGIQSATAPCDGISIGIGFVTSQATLGEASPASIPTGCVEGVGGAGGGGGQAGASGAAGGPTIPCVGQTYGYACGDDAPCAPGSSCAWNFGDEAEVNCLCDPTGHLLCTPQGQFSEGETCSASSNTSETSHSNATCTQECACSLNGTWACLITCPASAADENVPVLAIRSSADACSFGTNHPSFYTVAGCTRSCDCDPTPTSHSTCSTTCDGQPAACPGDGAFGGAGAGGAAGSGGVSGAGGS